tara:strand:- start:361 stop:1014 length:654 start_codon:yes stop_codon:yes gene_type:complete
MKKLILLLPRKRRISLEGHSGFKDGKIVLHDTKPQLEVFFLGLDVQQAESILLPLIKRRDYDCKITVPPPPQPQDKVRLIVRCGYCESGLAARSMSTEGPLFDTEFLNDLITDAVNTDDFIPRENLQYNETDVSTDLRGILRDLGILDSTDLATEKLLSDADSTELNTEQLTEFILKGLDILDDSTDLMTDDETDLSEKLTIQLSVEIKDVENWFGI